MTLIGHQLLMRFGERHLFQIERLTIAPGEAIWLRGANGTGKSTLLKILAGLHRPTRGHTNTAPGWGIRLRRWLRRESVKSPKRVIYLHQTPYLFDRSVLGNVRWALGRGARAEARAWEALERVSLTQLAQAHVNVLSGGERQRLAMARAWARQPDFLLMDEPTANLDGYSIALMAALAAELRQQGCGLIIISHQSNALTALCERQWHLAQGRLLSTPLPLCEPQDARLRHHD